jgi:hypothetical protein
MKTKEEYVREIISDYDKILEVISNAPQTYNSILQSCKDNGTMQQILRRRIRILLKEQRIWKMRVPGTRCGLAMFCTPIHDYKIIISQGMIGVRIFYLINYKETDAEIILNNYWELKGPNFSNWIYSDDEHVIKRYALRDEVFRIWE